jgi:hypothetical protein
LSAPSSFCASGTVSIDWLLPAKSYFGNRFSTLNQITPDNVRTLIRRAQIPMFLAPFSHFPSVNPKRRCRCSIEQGR